MNRIHFSRFFTFERKIALSIIFSREIVTHVFLNKTQCETYYETVYDTKYKTECETHYKEECYGYGYHKKCKKVPVEKCHDHPVQVCKLGYFGI